MIITEQGFIPLTSQLGISGTSYRLQLGLINEKWASRIMKGKDVIDSYVYKETEISGEFPNQNYIVGWVLRTVAIPNINPHQIMKTVQALVKQAVQRRSEKRIVAPVEETRKVELEKVPQSEIKRPQSKGWVKEEGMVSAQEKEEEMRQAFQTRMAAKKEEEAAKAAPTMKSSRTLPSIPGGATKEKEAPVNEEDKVFCPYCGKDLSFKFCPYCGKPLPHK